MSVRQSVCHSVTNAYLFIRLTSIFYNSKSDRDKTEAFANHNQTYLEIIKVLKSLKLLQCHVLQYLFIKERKNAQAKTREENIPKWTIQPWIG